MKRLTTLVALIVLAACQEPQSTNYYRAHIEKRDRKIDACLAAGDLGAECKNAKAAYPTK
ncbi:EexN family lipoprotein [Sphingomonas sp.]|uniref:EexN family lipoprotein n=1 Tax=Sphingomonas sp. TaxID=28214 RepID=UPI003B00EF35